MRKGGVIIEMRMVKEDGNALLDQLYLDQFPEPASDNFPLNFSNTWRDNFFKRNDFLFRMIGTNKNIPSVKPSWLRQIKVFHFETRALQLSQINDLKFSFTEPYYVFTRDQVTSALCPSHVKTIENKGVEEVFDCANSDKDSIASVQLTLLLQ